MKLSYKVFIALFVISLAGGLVSSTNHYYGLYKNEQNRANIAELLAHQRQITINDLQARQDDAANKR